MKTFTVIPVIIAIVLILASQFASADNGKFIEAMRKQIDAVYKAQTIDEFRAAVNGFERIGAAEKNKWEPYYYSAFGYIMMATREQDNGRKDSYLDEAMKAIEAGEKLAPQESELAALKGFAYMMRVTVDPGARGPQFAPLSMQNYEKALKLNPENPRAYALLAQMQYGTTQFFGSSTTEACETLNKSIEKFDSYKSENPLAPQWGRGMADEMKGNCK